jgi:translation initiation factor 2 beta subunit (eIF-2beta)/eIF-5
MKTKNREISKAEFIKILEKYYEQPQEIISKFQGKEILLEDLCKILLEKIRMEKTILFLREIGFTPDEISEALLKVI